MKFRDPAVLVPAPRHDDTPTWLSLIGAALLIACFVGAYAVFG